jgi:hypothetical protein
MMRKLLTIIFVLVTAFAFTGVSYAAKGGASAEHRQDGAAENPNAHGGNPNANLNAVKD